MPSANSYETPLLDAPTAPLSIHFLDAPTAPTTTTPLSFNTFFLLEAHLHAKIQLVLGATTPLPPPLQATALRGLAG